jgi:hypothetical protein
MQSALAIVLPALRSTDADKRQEEVTRKATSR